MSLIRQATEADALAISTIYNYYVLHTIVTFEETVVSESDMRARIALVLSRDQPWIVCENNGEVVGYAYAGEWKSRCAYRYSLESTVYLKHGEEGHGFGSILYGELIRLVKEKKYHAVIGGISLPNAASVALHEKYGFRKIGQFLEVGYKFGQWIDVGYWELIF